MLLYIEYMNKCSYIKALDLETTNTTNDEKNLQDKNTESQRNQDLAQIIQKLPKEELLYDLAEFFKIFGDSSRIRILSLLREDKFCVNEIAQLLQLSPSAISHQLRILRQARLVRYQKIGKEVFYSLDDDHIEKILDQGLEHIKEM